MTKFVILLFAVVLTGCTVPTEPTPSGVKDWMEPDTMRIVTEVDENPGYRDPVNGVCSTGYQKALRYAVLAKGDKRISEQFKVLKCVRGI